MAQFDVYSNPNKQSKNSYPYILDVQHTLLASIATHIVIPLGNASTFKLEELAGLTPQVTFDGMNLLILTPQISSMPAEALKQPIGSLAHLRSEIVAAIDFSITGI